MQWIKNLKKLQANELNVMRWFLIAASTLSIMWGQTIIHFEPSIIEYFGQRLLFSVIWMGIFVASFFNEQVQQSIRFFSNANNYLFTLWVAWIMYINSFNGIYVYGFMVTFLCMAFFVKKPKYLLWFLVSLNIVVVTMALSNPPTTIHPFSLTVIFMSLSVATYLVFISRLFDSQKLQDLNNELELQIAERTAIAKSKVEELAASTETLERFAYVASHDLREPLRTISGFADLLKMDLEEGNFEELPNYANYIIDGVSRMDMLTNDLLAYSRLGRNKLAFESVDLERLVQEVISSFEDTIQQKKATIKIVGKLPTIKCGAGQMTQLFTSLIENGLKFNRNKPEVFIKANEKEEEWIFSVADNGIGIEAKYTPKVFEIFQRLHSKKDYVGTGVGLAICKKVVENHNGEIWFESERGEGSTFYFSIPKVTNE